MICHTMQILLKINIAFKHEVMLFNKFKKYFPHYTDLQIQIQKSSPFPLVWTFMIQNKYWFGINNDYR